MIPFKSFIKKSANTASQPISSQTAGITTQQQTWVNGAFSEEVNKLGYHKDHVYYHGTGHHFDHFKDNPTRHSTTPEHEVKGHYFTSDPMHAVNYAHRSAKTTGLKRRVIKAHLHFNNPYDATKDIKKHRRKGMTFSQAKNKAYSEVDRTKHDAVYHNGDAYNHSEYVAFHAHQIHPIKD